MLGSHGMGWSDKETMGGVAMDEPLTTVLLHAPTCGLERRPVPFSLPWSVLPPPEVDGVRGRDRLRTSYKTSPGYGF